MSSWEAFQRRCALPLLVSKPGEQDRDDELKACPGLVKEGEANDGWTSDGPADETPVGSYDHSPRQGRDEADSEQCEADSDAEQADEDTESESASETADEDSDCGDSSDSH